MDIQEVFQFIDDEDAVSFLQSLIQINSVNPPGAERAVAEAIKHRIAATELNVELDMLVPERANLLVSWPPAAESLTPGSKMLVFSGHFDTVPVGNVEWTHPVFDGERVDNRIYGRGSTDMKSGVAAMIIAMECIAKAKIKMEGTLRFIGTVGEEVDCLGAREVVRKGQINHATAIVVSEPTSNQIVIAHKGTLWLEVLMYGKTAHGSMPDHGINAIQAINQFITELNDYRLHHTPHEILGNSTMNIGMIKGGVSPNVVPDQCSVTIDIRTVPGQDHQAIVDEIKELAKRVSEKMSTSYQVNILNNLACVHTPPDDPFIQDAITIANHQFHRLSNALGVNYYTDASIFSQHLSGTPVLIFGPGEPSMAHQPDEWVEIPKYLEAIRFYIALALSYLQSNE